MNQKKIGILLSYGNIIITIITNLIYTPIMLKILGQSEYGIYTLSSSLVGYFSLDIASVANTVLGIIIAIFIAIINNNTFIKLYSLAVNLLPNIASILYIATTTITNTKIPNIVNNVKNNPFNL